MERRHLTGLVIVAAALAAPVGATVSTALEDASRGSSARPAPYLQCVPYARQLSGIRIYGDAHTWWGQAEGRYARGFRPKVGAVMAFAPHGNSRLGHVAAVKRIIDSRTVLISHANWSPINGRRGQIEENVRAVDVSPGNDWSRVRVWYGPAQALGTTHWPLRGFIYNERPRSGERLVRPTAAAPADAPALAAKPDTREAASRETARRGADPIGDIIAEKLRLR